MGMRGNFYIVCMHVQINQNPCSLPRKKDDPRPHDERGVDSPMPYAAAAPMNEPHQCRVGTSFCYSTSIFLGHGEEKTSCGVCSSEGREQGQREGGSEKKKKSDAERSLKNLGHEERETYPENELAKGWHPRPKACHVGGCVGNVFFTRPPDAQCRYSVGSGRFDRDDGDGMADWECRVADGSVKGKRGREGKGRMTTGQKVVTQSIAAHATLAVRSFLRLLVRNPGFACWLLLTLVIGSGRMRPSVRPDNEKGAGGSSDWGGRGMLSSQPGLK